MNDGNGQKAQAQVLIDRISAEVEAEIAAIRAEAEADAAALVQAARSRARKRVSAAVAEMRAQAAGELRMLEARLETERRQLHQAQDRAALDEGLTGLADELKRLWADSRNRAAWCTNLIAGAGARLQPGKWRIALAPGLDEAGLAAISKAVAQLAGEAPEVAVDPGLIAGLTITADTACLDGTLTALTTDRTRLSALFLSALDRLRKDADR
jgi:vacuolar-type H+-ATPase subunit E/Vma4